MNEDPGGTNVHDCRAGVRRGEVHLWVPPSGPIEFEDVRPDERELLSPEENDHVSRLSNRRARARFVAGRILMRRVLSLYLDTDPAALEFHYGANGKPELAGRSESPLCFNLSHSTSNVVMAVARASAIGVDIERTDRADTANRIARRFFSPSEIDEIEALGADAPRRALQMWSMKESVVKANGDTVWDGLAKVSIRVENRRIRWSAPLDADDATWQLAGGNFRDTHFLAVAVKSDGTTRDRVSNFVTYQLGNEIIELPKFEPEFRG